MGYFEEMVARMEREQKTLQEEDAKAKAAGKLVGRYYKEQIADGYAYYRVVKATKTRVTLEHVAIGDAWLIRWIEDSGRKVARKVVEANIQRRDGLAAFFAGKSVKKVV